MKKITLLSAVLVAGMATAQVQVPMNMEIRKAEFSSIEMTAEVTMEEWNAEYVAKQNAAAADYAAHDYYFTEGMMHFGYTPQFYGFLQAGILKPIMHWWQRIARHLLPVMVSMVNTISHTLQTTL